MAVHHLDSEDHFDDCVVYLTREEGLAVIDEHARKYLNMSGEEFLRRWETGDFDDPDSYEVFRVGILVPVSAQ